MPADGLLRERRPGAGRVTFVELFFDLVFALAITQLSRALLADLSVRGAARALLLLLAVWWAWVDIAWFTNWFDPDRRAVRLTLLTAMLLGLLLSAALPQAFSARGLAFAGAYAALQVGHTAFIVAALGGQPPLRRNFQRILVWRAGAAAIWLAGGLAHGAAREWLWAAAVAVDLGGAMLGFFIPGLGRSRTTDWTITGGHLAERFQLFVILALGESIIVTGATFGELRVGAATLAAFVVAFVGSAALWWVYFDRSAEAAGAAIAGAADPGRLGRSAYTYFHLPMVAGIIVAAVADERVIAHPRGHADAATIAAALGGPALFLAGHALFKWAAFGHVSLARLVAIVVLAALAPLGTLTPPLALSALAAAVVVAVAAWGARTERLTPDDERFALVHDG